MSGIERVIILASDRAEPTYHRFDDVRMVNSANEEVTWNAVGSSRPVAVTKCGRAENYYSSFVARLRRDHALHFAAPCMACFPEVYQ